MERLSLPARDGKESKTFSGPDELLPREEAVPSDGIPKLRPDRTTEQLGYEIDSSTQSRVSERYVPRKRSHYYHRGAIFSRSPGELRDKYSTVSTDEIWAEEKGKTNKRVATD